MLCLHHTSCLSSPQFIIQISRLVDAEQQLLKQSTRKIVAARGLSVNQRFSFNNSELAKSVPDAYR